MCLAQGLQHSDAGEARTRGPSVSSQALYHWATALPIEFVKLVAKRDEMLGKPRILSLFPNSFNKFNKIWALM